MFAAASPWVQRFLPLIPRGPLPVLDLACGEGRHLRLLIGQGYKATGLDKRITGLADILGEPALELIQRDLEDGSDWPLAGRQFGGVIITNYLHRPLFPNIIDVISPGGVLIYETFMVGHERIGRPSSPAYLLEPGELLTAFGERLQVVAFEQGEVSSPRQAVVQRIVARAPSPDNLPTTLPSSGANSPW
ncbi:MAG: class I SAM-dependent methyltransferase [Alphaproteobacteria bacterium]|nr:class I SAM-dependent methyltransferase [Alphaproteobacteria bacterium SS10]